MSKRQPRGAFAIPWWVAPILLLVCTGLLYSGAGKHTRLPQEPELIWENPSVTGETGPSPLMGRFGAGEARPQVRPVAVLTRRLENALFDYDRSAYQTDQIALHGLAAVAVYFLLGRWLRSRIAAILGALVFVVHPALAHSVLYLGGISEILSSIFVYSALLLMTRAGDSARGMVARSARGSLRRPILLGGLAFLAMLAKETGFLLPLIALPLLLIGDHAGAAGAGARGGIRRSMLLPLVGGTAAAGLYWIAAMLLTPEPLRRIPAVDPTTAMPTGIVLPGSFAGMGFLLMALVAPFRLTHEYSWLYGASGLLRVAGIAVAAIGVGGSAWLVLRSKDRFLVASLLLAVLPLLAPAILPGIVGTLASERSLYLALPGWVALATRGLQAIVAKRPNLGSLFVGVAAGVVLCLAVLTIMRLPSFATGDELLASGLRVHSSNPQLLFERGNARFSAQDHAGAAQDYQAAIAARGGTFQLASVNLAAVYIAQKDLGMALRVLDPVARSAKHVRALRLIDAKAHYHAGLVLVQQDRQKEAAEAFERTLLFYPDHLGARGNLGLLYVKAPNYVDRGIEHLRYAIANEKDPARRAGLEKGLQRAESLIDIYIQKYGVAPSERDKPADGVLGVPWETVAREGM